MKSMPIPLLLLPLLMLPPSARAFAPPSSPSSRRLLVAAAPRTTTTTTSLAAKNGGKKKKSRSNNASGAGFGKAPATTTTATATATAPPATLQDEGAASASISGGLQSIDGGGTQQQRQPEVELDLPDDMPEEERSRAILRQKFGLKSYEEQQADIGDYRAVLDAEKKKEKRNKLRNLDEVWPEDADVLAVLPPVAIRGIDTFLKVGLGVCTVTFLVAGIFITVEAWSKATGGELPAGLGLWIESVVEPNFTPGLGVLLAFSVSLGLFSVALGGSASSTYREDP